MKAELKKLPESLLREIARDYSITAGTREEIIKELSEYFRSYSIRWADVEARYQLQDYGKKK
jgi:hypothetical protein